MKKILVLLFTLSAMLVSSSQEKPGKPAASTQSNISVSDSEPATAYKLNFKVYELEGGKRTNERDFALMANAAHHQLQPSSLRIGTRVPVGSGSNQNYLDVGFNVWARLIEQPGKLLATIKMEMSSFALPQQSTDSRESSMPVLRNSNFTLDTVLIPGKSQLISSIDDPNSKKTIQVEVLATRMD